ncbi:MAG: glycosyltransferase family 4 protein [Candidatus Latescibacterota bacterium]|nr:MAG: glycosyltransferase family 4 protein [Candidatus Latescibacterota bacterium]
MNSSSRFRILMADSIRIWGGAQRFIVELAEGLTTRGHHVTIQTLPGSPLAGHAGQRGLPVREVWTRADSAPWTVIPLVRAIHQAKYDVIITTFDKDLRTTGLAGRIVARLTRRPITIFHTRECDDPLKNKPRYRWFYTKVADHIIVNSRATLDTTLGSAPWLSRDRISILYKGIDLSDYANPDPGPWRRRLDPGGGSVVIGYAGQLIARKRIDVLLGLLASPDLAGLDWRLAIAGKGPEEDALQDQARRLGVQNRVEFCGFVDGIPAWMSALDLFVLPSFIEGFGYVLAEAGAAGVPSVAYEASSIPEVVIDGETALLAPEADDAAFARHIKTLITDKALRERMGQAARHDVFDRHGLDTMVERMESILTDVSAGPHHR